MKLFRTSSSQLIKECQLNFGFLPVSNQLTIRTANFLQVFIASENTLCQLFVNNATSQLMQLFSQYGNNIKTASHLRTVISNQFYSSSNWLSLVSFHFFFSIVIYAMFCILESFIFCLFICFAWSWFCFYDLQRNASSSVQRTLTSIVESDHEAPCVSCMFPLGV